MFSQVQQKLHRETEDYFEQSAYAKSLTQQLSEEQQKVLKLKRAVDLMELDVSWRFPSAYFLQLWLLYSVRYSQSRTLKYSRQPLAVRKPQNRLLVVGTRFVSRKRHTHSKSGSNHQRYRLREIHGQDALGASGGYVGRRTTSLRGTPATNESSGGCKSNSSPFCFANVSQRTLLPLFVSELPLPFRLLLMMMYCCVLPGSRSSQAFGRKARASWSEQDRDRAFGRWDA